MSELIERLRALARHEHSDVSIAEEAADALEARTAGEVDGDAIAEVVAYLNGHKTEPAKRMADAVLRLLNRHYQDAAALEAAREDGERWRQAFVDERASRYRADGMKIEQARIHAETDAEVAAIDQARGK